MVRVVEVDVDRTAERLFCLPVVEAVMDRFGSAGRAKQAAWGAMRGLKTEACITVAEHNSLGWLRIVAVAVVMVVQCL